ncbi:MAG: Holliday junction branch migration protein RuvA [Salana multivorans]|uniref:Holliday junction branch migration protein RuvA n=1 Tax=Salana multivorans TaxID=120377 RepID=UPI00095DD24C|nr:Holliday junction branch migration protein RuvA [Salana multivorans]MBN8883101.1 Holliday junction branch migration protein RuvA [Salana multivorans]OJX94388.1 MAG: Holliday junction DNA helicase RuvA [Micrococcales bacterium 73-15]
MIALVRGEVAAIGLDHAVLVVSGVGMRVHATPNTLAGLRHGNEAELHTTLVVREDSLTLFGFLEVDERDTFEILQTVSGVGPRLALAMLAVHPPDALRQAVATEDLKALERVPGIGRKGASRIVLELGGRLGAPTGGGGAGGTATAVTAPSAVAEDVVVALQGLGWNAKVAADAVAGVLEAGDAPATDAGEILRAALRSLATDGR